MSVLVRLLAVLRLTESESEDNKACRAAFEAAYAVWFQCEHTFSTGELLGHFESNALKDSKNTTSRCSAMQMMSVLADSLSPPSCKLTGL